MSIEITNAEARQLLHDLVTIPSPSTQEAEAVNFLVQWMRDHGYDEAFVDEAGNAVGIIGNGSREIVLLGHIDTFGGMPEVRIEGDILYGRGSVDAKGPLCGFAVAARRSSLPDDVRLVVIGAVEEEASSSKGARFASTQYSPEMCIIGEPSQWDRMTLGYKGRLLLKYRWYGGLSHSAGQAQSPAEYAVNFWRVVQAYASEYNVGHEQMFTQLDVTLQEINTSQAGAYGVVDMLIGFRLPPDFDCTVMKSYLDDSVGDDAIIEYYGYEKAYAADRNSDLARLFRRVFRSQSVRPKFVYKTGTSDMNVVAPVWDCDLLAYGAGDSTLDHTPQEHVSLSEYKQAIDILSDLLSFV